MRQSGQKFGQFSKKSGQLSQTMGHLSNECAAKIVDFLRARYGGARIPESVEVDTGIPAATVRKWIDRASAPSLAAFVTLIANYGPEFLACVLPRSAAWLDTAARASRHARIQRQIDELESEVARLEAHSRKGDA